MNPPSELCKRTGDMSGPYRADASWPKTLGHTSCIYEETRALAAARSGTSLCVLSG